MDILGTLYEKFMDNPSLVSHTLLALVVSGVFVQYKLATKVNFIKKPESCSIDICYLGFIDNENREPIQYLRKTLRMAPKDFVYIM